MKLTLGIAVGVSISILAHIIWKPALGWALSRGDTMMASLTNPDTRQTVTVPDHVADSYVSQGWVRPGTPAPAEPGLDSLTIPQLRHFATENGVDLAGMKRKSDIVAAIEMALGPTSD